MGPFSTWEGQGDSWNERPQGSSGAHPWTVTAMENAPWDRKSTCLLQALLGFSFKLLPPTPCFPRMWEAPGPGEYEARPSGLGQHQGESKTLTNQSHPWKRSLKQTPRVSEAWSKDEKPRDSIGKLEGKAAITQGCGLRSECLSHTQQDRAEWKLRKPTPKVLVEEEQRHECSWVQGGTLLRSRQGCWTLSIQQIFIEHYMPNISLGTRDSVINKVKALPSWRLFPRSKHPKVVFFRKSRSDLC